MSTISAPLSGGSLAASSAPTSAAVVSPSASAPAAASTGGKNLRIAAAKPRITIQIPPPYAAGGHPTKMSSASAGVPMSASLSGTTPYVNPLMVPTKSGGFVFQQFEGLKDFTFASAKSGLNIGEKSAFYIYEKFSKWSRQWFTHLFLFIVIFLYSVAGAFLFVALEGPQQQRGILFVRELKHNLSESLHNLAQDRYLQQNFYKWEAAVNQELEPFIGNLTLAIKAGHFDEDQKAKPPTWSFWNAMFYCGTIYTTIGYGHIYPVTNAGRALTIVYAIIGIPMFLILLADFGKMFTRAIKVLWRYVRRLYYTGSLRRVRKQAQVQEVLRGMNIAVATLRRPSMAFSQQRIDEFESGEAAAAALAADAEAGRNPNQLHATNATMDSGADNGGGVDGSQPVTPAPTDLDLIDDEFNLPISLAIFLLLAYILCGAFVYSLWEDWTFFEASYFVFISMSTIGFGDYVPKHPMFMMASILYLVFGLALTSMCINVVQLKLSDSFRQASAKISASIGMVLAEAEAAEEESRRSQGTLTPGGIGGGDCGDGEEGRAVRLPLITVQEEEEGGERNKTRVPAADSGPPALPPKRVNVVNETSSGAKSPGSEEMKKRRKFWK